MPENMAPEFDTSNPRAGETPYGKVSRLIARGIPVKPFYALRPAAIVSFSFDDCFDSAAGEGADILTDADVRGSFYVSRNLCGGSFLGARYLPSEQLRELDAAGHEIGCHSASHSAFVSRSRQEMARDWQVNAAFLREAGQIEELHTFSYPFGYFDWRAASQAARRFAACRGTRPGINHRLLDLASLRANPVGPDTTHVRNGLDLIRQVKQTGGWLIFYTHDVSQSPTPYGCTPDALRTLVQESVSTGLTVLPIRNAVGALAASR